MHVESFPHPRGSGCLVHLLRLGSSILPETEAALDWLRRHPKAAAGRRISFFYEFQAAGGDAAGFEYYRELLPAAAEDRAYDLAEQLLREVEPSLAPLGLPRVGLFLATQNQGLQREAMLELLLDEAIALHDEAAASPSGPDLVLVHYHPGEDLQLVSPEQLGREWREPEQEHELRELRLLSHQGPARAAGGPGMALLVEDSGTGVNLVSALAIADALVAREARVFLVTHSPAVVDAVLRGGGEEFHLNPEDRLIEGQGGSARQRWLGRLAAWFKSSLVAPLPEPLVNAVYIRYLRWCRWPLSRLWARLRVSGRRVSATEFGITLPGPEQHRRVLQSLARRLPYQLQIHGRRCQVEARYLGRLRERLAVVGVLAVGESNVGGGLQAFADMGLPTTGVVPILVSAHPTQRFWPAQRHLVYGEQAAEVLRGAGVDPAAIEVVGSEHYDRYVRRATGREEDRRRFLTDHPQAEGRPVAILATEALPGVRAAMAATIRALLAVEELFLLVKLHPDDSKAAYAALLPPAEQHRWALRKDYPLARAIHAAELLLASHSNVMIECSAVGVPALRLTYLGPSPSLDFVAEGLCLGADSPAEVESRVRALLQDQGLRQQAGQMLGEIRRFNGPNDGRAAARIAAACLPADQAGTPGQAAAEGG